MKCRKTEIILTPIYESLVHRYQLLYSENLSIDSIEYSILQEQKQLVFKLTVEESLLLSNMLVHLNQDLVSKEQKLWREFVLIHLIFLFGHKVLTYDSWLLSFACDAINKVNIKNVRYLSLFIDNKWVMKIYEHALSIDFSSTLTYSYQIELERIRRVFLFLCRKIEASLDITSQEVELKTLKQELLKMIKTYHSEQLFKRSVVS